MRSNKKIFKKKKNIEIKNAEPLKVKRDKSDKKKK